MHSPILY